VPIPQNYTGTNHWSIPLQPVYATTPMSTKTNFMKGAVAIAVNGIPRSEEVKQKLRKPKHAGHGEAVSKGRKGIKFTEEHLKNLSESHKGQISSMKGKKHTEESRKKMSTSQKNRPEVTKEYREKMSAIVKEIWAKRKAEGMLNVG
jgi:hypothetical protein